MSEQKNKIVLNKINIKTETKEPKKELKKEKSNKETKETIDKKEKLNSSSISIVIVEKGGTLKSLAVKEFKQEDLYKKCGFKQPSGFDFQTDWIVKIDSQQYQVALYAKSEGKANTENKYDFPPPVDSTLYFGSCALIGYKLSSSVDGNEDKVLCNLSVELWKKIYEKLFGGFEDLAAEDEDDDASLEEDMALDALPKSKKTKVGGYLKDGFVVSDEDCEDEMGSGDYSDGTDDEEEEDENILKPVRKGQDDDDLDITIDYGSELSEEEYMVE